MNLTSNARNALNWLLDHSSNYVYVSNKNKEPYPEVTGYLIPTLQSVGLHKKASEFADYLIQVQNQDGSWSFRNKKYIFDTSQIIHGLSYFSGYENEISLGLNFVLDKLRSKDLDHNHKIPIHIYPRILWALQTVGCDVSEFLPEFCSPESRQFNCNSHFWGYSFEGHARMGLDCQDFIQISNKYNGKIPEKYKAKTYCFTGLSQTALSLFLLNKFDLGINALSLVSSFQSKNGGFLGSNGNYFNDTQISWAAKFYIDAFLEGSKLQNILAKDSFKDSFESKNDERFIYVKSKIKKNSKVLDVGCGKGRYINNLTCCRHACDLYDASKYLVDTKFLLGTCLNLPYEDDFFDHVICCETLDLTPFYENALQELLRVIKPSGSLVLIEKEGPIPVKSQFNELRINFQNIKNIKEIKQLVVENSSIKFIGVEIYKPNQE